MPIPNHGGKKGKRWWIRRRNRWKNPSGCENLEPRHLRVRRKRLPKVDPEPVEAIKESPVDVPTQPSILKRSLDRLSSGFRKAGGSG